MASVEKIYPAAQSTVISAQEGAGTQTFDVGDLVKFDSSGQVVVATAGVIHGIARQDATGTQATKLEVELIDPNAIYCARYKAAATAQALVGDILDFTFTIGAHTLDEGSATTDVYCVGLDNRDVVTTSGGRLLFRFLGTLFTGI